MAAYERYLAGVAAIRAVGRSPRGWVTVTREPSGDLDVQIQPGMLCSCTSDEVADEIRGGLIAVLADHRRQFRQLRIDHFGSPLGVEEFIPPPSPSLTEPHGGRPARMRGLPA